MLGTHECAHTPAVPRAARPPGRLVAARPAHREGSVPIASGWKCKPGRTEGDRGMGPAGTESAGLSAQPQLIPGALSCCMRAGAVILPRERLHTSSRSNAGPGRDLGFAFSSVLHPASRKSCRCAFRRAVCAVTVTKEVPGARGAA